MIKKQMLDLMIKLYGHENCWTIWLFARAEEMEVDKLGYALAYAMYMANEEIESDDC